MKPELIHIAEAYLNTKRNVKLRVLRNVVLFVIWVGIIAVVGYCNIKAGFIAAVVCSVVSINGFIALYKLQHRAGVLMKMSHRTGCMATVRFLGNRAQIEYLGEYFTFVVEEGKQLGPWVFDFKTKKCIEGESLKTEFKV